MGQGNREISDANSRIWWNYPGHAHAPRDRQQALIALCKRYGVERLDVVWPAATQHLDPLITALEPEAIDRAGKPARPMIWWKRPAQVLRVRRP